MNCKIKGNEQLHHHAPHLRGYARTKCHRKDKGNQSPLPQCAPLLSAKGVPRAVHSRAREPPPLPIYAQFRLPLSDCPH